MYFRQTSLLYLKCMYFEGKHESNICIKFTIHERPWQTYAEINLNYVSQPLVIIQLIFPNLRNSICKTLVKNSEMRNYKERSLQSIIYLIINTLRATPISSGPNMNLLLHETHISNIIYHGYIELYNRIMDLFYWRSPATPTTLIE